MHLKDLEVRMRWLKVADNWSKSVKAAGPEEARELRRKGRTGTLKPDKPEAGS